MAITVGQQQGISDDIRLHRLRRHTTAVRENLDVVLAILEYLHMEPPNASAAREVLSECDRETQIDLWSCSPTAGGIWQTWMRDALKYGELTRSYDTYLARTGRQDTRSLNP